MLLNVRGYLEHNSHEPKEPLFTQETPDGILIGIGGAKFWIGPYREGEETVAFELPGILSLTDLKALDLEVPEAVVEGLVFAGGACGHCGETQSRQNAFYAATRDLNCERYPHFWE